MALSDVKVRSAHPGAEAETVRSPALYGVVYVLRLVH